MINSLVLLYIKGRESRAQGLKGSRAILGLDIRREVEVLVEYSVELGRTTASQ